MKDEICVRGDIRKLINADNFTNYYLSTAKAAIWALFNSDVPNLLGKRKTDDYK